MSATENNSIWLSQEINSKNPIISSFTFAIGVQKDNNFPQNFGTRQNTVSFQLLFDKQSDTDKKDQSFPP